MTDINVPTKTLAQRASVWLKINEGRIFTTSTRVISYECIRLIRR
jgi:hypothetical protein